jgi:murein L,D-transpeptidase YafK
MDIALGLVPVGHKQREGDFRTPEGVYYLEAKNADSDYFLSLKVSYPNAADRAHARQLGVDPGGQIMIHGLPNEPKYDEDLYRGWDWTDGCIAVSNSDMVDLWLMTSVSIPIEIRP